MVSGRIVKCWMGQLTLFFLLAYHSCSQVQAFSASNPLDSILLELIETSSQQEFDVNLLQLQKFVLRAQAVKDHRNEIRGNINIGLLYINYNNDEEALNYLLLSLDMTKQYGYDELLNSIYNNIGIIYSSNGEFKKAEDYFREALKISQARGEEEKIAINLVNLGVLKNEQKEMEMATAYYQDALKMFTDLGDTINMTIVLNNIGTTYYDDGNYVAAKSYFRQALTLAKDELSKFYLPSFQLNYGKVAYELQEYDTALLFIKAALDTFLVVKNTEKIIESNFWLAKTYDQKNQYTLAKLHYEKSLSWKDTLLNEKNQFWISEMQMKYEFGKKEKEIEYLQEKARQEKWIWGGIIITVFLFSTLFFYFLRAKNINLSQKNIILKQDQEVANLEIIKSQLLQEKLRQKLEANNRELASKALHLLNKNEILTTVTSLLDKFDVQHATANAKLIRNAKRTISQNINLDKQWQDFKIHFEEVNTGFFTHLLERFPNLSQIDLRLCAYLLMNLDTKEIAQISNISPDSVRKRKQRLREKLQLSKDQDIKSVLRNSSGPNGK